MKLTRLTSARRGLHAWLVLVWSCGGGLGCTTFNDVERPRTLDQDAGVRSIALPDAQTPVSDAADRSVVDAPAEVRDGASDSDSGEDAAEPHIFQLADSCLFDVMELEPSANAVTVSTSGLSDDVSSLSQCGLEHAWLSPEGFFTVNAIAGQRWHIMARPTAPEQDIAVYYLPACDGRSCLKGQDTCGRGEAEHTNFVAPSAGSYLVGVESTTEDDVVLLALTPICGNGARNHGETCDDGNAVESDGCDRACRVELLDRTVAEAEPNDDALGANVIRFADGEASIITIAGQLGSGCDVDRFSLTPPRETTVRAFVFDGAGNPCDPSHPAVTLELIRPDRHDSPVTLRQPVPAGEACPSLEAIVGRSEEIHVRVSSSSDEPFTYQLVVEVLDPK